MQPIEKKEPPNTLKERKRIQCIQCVQWIIKSVVPVLVAATCRFMGVFKC